jgi:hypothetical protein
MRRLAALLLLAPAVAWASLAAEAERAAERVLVEENVLAVYFTANDAGRLTILFGRQVGDGQIETVLKRFAQEPAIHGVTHTRVDADYCPIR